MTILDSGLLFLCHPVRAEATRSVKIENSNIETKRTKGDTMRHAWTSNMCPTTKI